MAQWLCDRNLWKTKNGQIVEDGDPRSAFLFATPGMVLGEKPVVEKLPGEQKSLIPDEDKAIYPDEDKGIAAPEKKRARNDSPRRRK